MDSAFNLVSEFTAAASGAFGTTEDVQLCTSNGTAPNITGSLDTPNADSAGAQSITAVTEATSGTLTYADLVKLFFAVPKAYRNSDKFAWVVNTAQAILLTTLETTAGDLVLKDPAKPGQIVGDSVPNQIGMIFSKPVVEAPIASANNRILCGDFDYVAILDGPSDRMEIESTNAAQWTSDLIDYKITTRWDGGVVSTTPFRIMDGLTIVG